MDPPRGVRVEARQLSFSTGSTTLLGPLSLSFRPGETVGILGPSGAGKSTLMKLLSGVNRDGEGEVRYDGRDLWAEYGTLKHLVGFVPQDDVVHASLTPRSELTFGCRLRAPDLGEEAVDKRVDEVLAQVEMTEAADRYIRNLSGGQRKRVSLGLELLTSPPVLFLDEPTSGLDPALEEKMMEELFQRLARDGRTVLVTTHVMESLDRLDLVLVLMKGKLVFLGPPRAALGHFSVGALSDMYGKLEGRSPGEWELGYQGSGLYGEYVRKRLEEPAVNRAEEKKSEKEKGEGRPAASRSQDPEIEELLAELKRNRGP